MLTRNRIVTPLYENKSYKNLGVNYIRLQRGTKAEHEHASLQISVALSRQPLVATERSSFGTITKKPMFRGESCVISSWQPHTIKWRGLAEWVSFHFEPQYIRRAAREFRVKPSVEIVSSFCARDAVIFGFGRALSDAMQRDKEPFAMHIQSLAAGLIEHLLTNYAAEKTNAPQISRGGLAPAKLRRAVEFIDENFARNLTIDELASIVDLSPFHFARSFKESTGIAPHQFVVRRRIERAKIMLLNKKVSIGEISRLVGYESHSRFSHLFFRHTKLTPQKFRELF